MYDSHSNTTPSEYRDAVSGGHRDAPSMGREVLSSGELRDKTIQRIHDVLTVYPGSSIATMHTAVRPYNSSWRSIFEQMIASEDIRRETVEFKGRYHYKHYTNHGQGEVTKA